jgi:hypothetical protein
VIHVEHLKQKGRLRHNPKVGIFKPG